MATRESKERKLKRNVEINTERAVRNRSQELERELTGDEKASYRQAFEESANRIDSNGRLTHIWNDKPFAATDGNTLIVGYFGGLNFDENGKIIQ